MQVTLLCYGPLEALPPVMNVAFALRHTCTTLRVAASTIAHETSVALQNIGVIPLQLCPGEEVTRNPLNRAARYVSFNRAAGRLLSRLPKDEALWVGSAPTAVAAGSALHPFRYALQLHELYDTHRMFRSLLSSAIR